MIAETQIASLANLRADVVAAIKTASAKTGSDFDYLLTTAMRESGLDSHAKSATSSASGLFQFIEQTWLGFIKRYGERHGMSDLAAAIQETKSGRYEVASKETRSAILALRQDAQVSSLMAGEAAHETKQALECRLGRQVCSGELYAAHFLGQGGARELIELNASSPNARADLAFPQAANANKSVFYHSDGRPKTVAEVYAWTAGASRSDSMNAAAVQQSAPQVKAEAAPPASVPHYFSPMLAQTTPHRAPASGPHWLTERPTPTHTAPYLRLSPGMLEMLAALAPAQLAPKRAA
jgi:hypothetical protein